jgi:hypothetical protein
MISQASRLQPLNGNDTKQPRKMARLTTALSYQAGTYWIKSNCSSVQQATGTDYFKEPILNLTLPCTKAGQVSPLPANLKISHFSYHLYFLVLCAFQNRFQYS